LFQETASISVTTDIDHRDEMPKVRVMNQPDELSEELLSAYLDGELSSEEVREVDRLLAEHPQFQQRLAEFRALGRYLQQLPRQSLSHSAAARIAQAIERAAAQPLDEEPAEPALDELLSAYLDGELSGAAAQQVADRLASDPVLHQAYRELSALRDSFRTLPTYRLDDGFAERVLRHAERHMLAAPDDHTAAVSPAALAPAVSRPSRRRQAIAWISFAAAASLLLAVSIPLLIGRPAPELAQPNGVTPATDQSPVPVIPPPPEAAPSALVQPGPSPRLPAPVKPAARPADPGPLTLVSQPMREQLLLVYELSVTPEGVQSDVFTRLLLRHGVTFNQTVVVNSKDQQALLTQRYLQGVVAGGRDRKDMDEINLFLVFCKASQADALFNDLAGRPAGVAGFGLNLTTHNADSGIVQRARRAQGAVAQSGTALQLLADFAILSRTGRHLGAFGAIRWVDPALLAPPPKSPKPTAPAAVPVGTDSSPGITPNTPLRNAEADAPPGAPAAPSVADFDCELLFVVRNLKPLPEVEGK
jgi:anti-sigma factor RsiW